MENEFILGFSQESKAIRVLSSFSKVNNIGVNLSLIMLIDHVISEIVSSNKLYFKTEKCIFSLCPRPFHEAKITFSDAINLSANSIRHFDEWQYLNNDFIDRDGKAYTQGKRLSESLDIDIEMIGWKTKNDFF